MGRGSFAVIGHNSNALIALRQICIVLIAFHLHCCDCAADCIVPLMIARLWGGANDCISLEGEVE